MYLCKNTGRLFERKSFDESSGGDKLLASSLSAPAPGRRAIGKPRDEQTTDKIRSDHSRCQTLLLLFLFFGGGGGTTESTWYVGHYEPAPDDDECEADGGIIISGENGNTRRKPAPVPLYPSQISHGLTWDRTRAATVGSRRLTASAMARPRCRTWSLCSITCTTINYSHPHV
jgi:hypothetical protein